MREELMASGRSLDRSDWVERVVQGEATPQDLVGWARQHYWGVTYHTRRVLSAWVTRMPYEMTDDVIENVAEEVLGTQSKAGHGHLHWLFEFTQGPRCSRRGHHRATPNVDAVASSSFLYNLAFQRPWYEVTSSAACSAIENQIPPAYTRVVEGFKHHYGHVLAPDDYRVPHHPHLGRRGARRRRRASSPSAISTRRRSAATPRVAYLAGAELARRCWDAFDGATW